MTDQTKNLPDFHAFNVIEAGEHRRWIRVGAAWNHADGEGLTVRLTAIPVDGTIVIRNVGDLSEGAQ